MSQFENEKMGTEKQITLVHIYKVVSVLVRLKQNTAFRVHINWRLERHSLAKMSPISHNPASFLSRLE